MKQPVVLFDAIGLALFAVIGAQKTLGFDHNRLMAVFLGTGTAVGGGAIRDIILNRIPMIMEKHIYAAAALLAVLIVVGGHYTAFLNEDIIALIAIGVCFTLRMIAVRKQWHLPYCSSERMERYNRIK